MMRINSIGPLDKIAWSPHVDFKLYIDNRSIAAVGTHREVVSGVVEGARALQSATAEIGATLPAPTRPSLSAAPRPSAWRSRTLLGLNFQGP
eukprot:7791262-Pyramimonas_sp.AAC.1